MSDHADGRPWTITRLLYSSQLPFLLLCTAVFAGAVLVLTFAIDLRVTITESVWDPAVSVVRWFAFGYGLYLLNRLLPLYVAAGRTRREFLGSVAQFVAGAGAVLAALLALGFALEGMLYRALGWTQGWSLSGCTTAPASSRSSSSATGPCCWSGRPSGCSWPPGSTGPAGASWRRSCWPWPWWW
jgi:hypothetical protein